MPGNPRCAQLLAHCLLKGPEKWLRNGHFLTRQTGSGATENLVLPFYRIVVQHMKNQILTEVTAEL